MRSWLAVIPVLALAVAACETAPVTGRSQLMLVSAGDEAKMGGDAYRDIIKKSRLSTDAAATEMVRRVGSRIAAVSGLTGQQWEYNLIVDDKQVNAFALPGGKIAVYTGILPVTRDEAGLAAVLGHEVAHVVARHGAERMSQQLGVQIGASLAGLAAGVATGNQGAVNTVAQLFGAGATVGVLLPWGRSQESEADHIGLVMMAKAGYDPHAARDLWVRMAENAKGASRPPAFLSTHPTEETRIQQIEGWLPEALRYYKPAR
jgi:predicted Zn-dependent protease